MFVSKFEVLDVFKRSRILTRNVYALTSRTGLSKDWGLRDQMRRSSVSIMSNIAEGFERNGRKEFARFIDIAKASCGELRAQFYVAEDAGYLEPSKAETFRKEAGELSRMLGGLKRAVLRSA